MIYEDIYYFSYEEAYFCAKQQNKMNEGYRLQICYYDGVYQENELINLVHLPIDNLQEMLALGTYRFPTRISFASTNFSDEVQELIKKNFMDNLQTTQTLRTNVNRHYFQTAVERKPNFNEPLRFFLSAHVNTEVMQYISKNIADTLQNNGYEVLLDYSYGIEDNKNLKKYVEFNPHVTININNLNNHFINEDVFNFIWFQDPMPVLLDNSSLKIRKRDIVYSLLNTLDVFLDRKKITFSRQSFCVNKDIFFNDPYILREKKIVFIGSSYLNMISPDHNTTILVKKIVNFFNQGKSFSKEVIHMLSNEFSIDEDLITTRIIPYVIRDFSVLNLCKLKTDYEIEVYGRGWDKYPQIKSFYKGILNYGIELSNIYNSATFVFAPHQNYVLQQRTLEGAACGAIPILYDCREFTDEENYDEAIYYFKKQDQLEKILNEKTSNEKDLSNLVNNNNYDSFVQRVVKTIEENKDAR